MLAGGASRSAAATLAGFGPREARSLGQRKRRRSGRARPWACVLAPSPRCGFAVPSDCPALLFPWHRTEEGPAGRQPSCGAERSSARLLGPVTVSRGAVTRRLGPRGRAVGLPGSRQAVPGKHPSAQAGSARAFPVSLSGSGRTELAVVSLLWTLNCWQGCHRAGE